jgi:hypothetical protein
VSIRILACAAAILFYSAAAPAFTQSFTETPRADVSAGVFLTSEANSFYAGIPVSGSIRAWGSVRFVGELTLCDCSSSVWAGARVQRPGRVSPFGQVLIALDALKLQPGGGVDVRFDKRMAARFGIDITVRGGEGPANIGVRFTTALVVSFGR